MPVRVRYMIGKTDRRSGEHKRLEVCWEYDRRTGDNVRIFTRGHLDVLSLAKMRALRFDVPGTDIDITVSEKTGHVSVPTTGLKWRIDESVTRHGKTRRIDRIDGWEVRVGLERQSR